jgi:arylsulfatase
MPRLLAAFAIALLAAPAHAADKPNIILIMADDMGYSDLGCYGSEIRTPNLDRLAAGGLRYTQFYNGTRCCPTRASLLTGLYPHQAGVGYMVADAGAKFPGYRGHLQPHTVTIAEALKPAGYRTYHSGKWHLNQPGPVERGFIESYMMKGGFRDYWQAEGYVRLPEVRPARKYEKGKFYSTDAITDHALDFLADTRKDGGGPFFLYLAYTAPHFPLHAPAEDIARYADGYAKGWDKLREERFERQQKLGLADKTWRLSPRSPYETYERAKQGVNPAWDTLDADRRADLARRMAIYAAAIDRMDQNIGRVLDDLKKYDQLDNTLIFFLSDNGACAEWDPLGFDKVSGPNNVLHKAAELAKMGGPGTYHSYGSGWANACNTPFRMYKHYCHEGGICTPLIVHWPAGIKAKGEFRKQASHIIDILPTCLDVAGAKYPEKRNNVATLPPEGVSIVPTFANKPLEKRFLAWEHEGNRAIRYGKWKLVARHDGRWELFDLDADRSELRNLDDKSPVHAAMIKELTNAWNEWAKRCLVVPAPEEKKAKP